MRYFYLALQTILTLLMLPVLVLAKNDGRIIEFKHKHFEVNYSEQGIRMMPTENKLDWQWQLKSVHGLSNYEAKAAPTVDGSDIFYHRGNITEQYLYRGNSVEQQFILNSLESITSDVIIEGKINSEGSFSVVEGGWNWSKGEAHIFLGDVFVYDANGEALPASMHVTAGTSQIVVSYGVLKTATFPVTIDPQIGPDDFVLVNNDIDKRFYQPKIIYNPSLAKIIASWTQYNNSNPQRYQDIYGASFDKNIVPKYVNETVSLGTFPISGGRPAGSSDYSSATSSDIAFCGNTNLIVWEDFSGITDAKTRILKRTASASASNNDTAALFNDATYKASYSNPLNPSVAGNDTKFVVVNTNSNLDSTNFYVLAQSINTNGTIVSDIYTPIFTSTNSFRDVKIDARPGGNFYIAASTGNSLQYGVYNGTNMISSSTIPADTIGSVDISAGNSNSLTVWSEFTGSFYTIKGSINGGSSFQIDTTTFKGSGKPSVAYSPTSNSWLVAWHGTPEFGNGTMIWAREIMANGTKHAITPISKQTRTSVSPTVAFDSGNNEFWIAWSGGGNKDQLLAQRWINSATGYTISMKQDTLREDYFGKSFDRTQDKLITTFIAKNASNDSIYPLDFLLIKKDTLNTSYLLTSLDTVKAKTGSTISDYNNSRNKLFYHINDTLNYERKSKFGISVYALTENGTMLQKTDTIRVVDVNETFAITGLPTTINRLEDNTDSCFIAFTVEAGDRGRERNSILFENTLLPTTFQSDAYLKANPLIPGGGHTDAIPRTYLYTNDTIRFALKPNENGSSQFTFRFTDQKGGEWESIGWNNVSNHTVTVNVIPVNDAPTFTAGPDTVVLEDCGVQNIAWATNISAGPNEATQSVAFVVNNNNPSLFETQPTINTSGILNFTPKTDSTGIATIRVRLGDNGGTANGGIDSSSVVTFNITVNQVNDAPTASFKTIDPLLEDATTTKIDKFLQTYSLGPQNEKSQTVSFSITNDNPTLFNTQPNLSLTDSSLNFSLKPDAFGTANLRIRISDTGGTTNGGTDTTIYFTAFTIENVNDAPSFNAGTNIDVYEDCGEQITAWATNISAGTNEDAQNIAFEVSNNNPSLFETQPSVNSSGILTFKPANDSTGTATVRVRLGDNGGTANGGIDSSSVVTFDITVNPVNDAPLFVLGSNPVTLEDASEQTITGWATSILAGPVNESAQNVSFQIITTQTDLFSAQPVLNSTTGTLTFTPAPNAFGVAFLDIVLTDDGGTGNGGISSTMKNATITISPVNDKPSFVGGADQTAFKGSGAKTIANWATQINPGATNESSQLLNFLITNDNPAIFLVQPFIDAVTGDLSYTPATDMAGSANIRVRLGDNGGTLDGGIDSSDVYNFAITVISKNSAPSFTSGGNVLVVEDAGLSNILWATDIVAGPAYESYQTLSFVLLNDNPDLFEIQPSLDPSTGILRFKAIDNEYGTANLKVQLRDDGGTENDGVDSTDFVSFTLTVQSVNDAPTFTKGANVTILEDSGLNTVTGWATSMLAGPANESTQSLTFSVTTDNDVLFSSLPSIDATTGTLTFSTASNQNGTANITVRLSDDGGTDNGGVDFSEQSFTITATAVNDAPSFAKGTDVIANEDGGAQTVTNWASNIAAGPTNESTQTLQFVVSNNNNDLFSVQPAVDATTGALTFTPDANQFGAATVSIQLRDDGGTANNGIDSSGVQTFLITLNPVNDAPTFTKGADVTVLEDSGLNTVTGWATSMLAGPANESSQTLNFSVTTNNDALFSSLPAIDATTGTLTFATASNQNGIANITVRLSDDGGTANGGVDFSEQTFTITVTAVNDAPSFTKGTDVTANEDGGAQTVTNWASNIAAGPANESTQALQFVVSNNNNTLFSVQPAVDATNGTLTFTPDANQYGTATVSIQLRDNGGTANNGIDSSGVQTFMVTINPVNDAPTFTKGADVTILEDSGSNTLTGWATNLVKGPANESSQTLNFSVTTNNDALFSSLPAIDATTGSLTFATRSNQHGTANIRIRLGDNGGTLWRGIDSSSVEYFQINIQPVNDKPFAVNSTVAFWENETHAFSSTEFGFADSADPGDQLDSIAILSAPLKGSLKFNGNTISTYPLKLKQNQISLVTYQPVQYEYGSPYVTLPFLVSDNNSTLATNGVQWSENSATLTINVWNVNQAPTDILISNQKVNENAIGASVGTLSCIDLDPADVHTYTLVSDPSGLFAIDGNGLRLKPGVSANFEMQSSYNLSIKVTDAEGESYTKGFTILIIDQNDLPESANLRILTREEKPHYFSIEQFTFTDEDANDQLFALELLRQTDNLPGALYIDKDNNLILTVDEKIAYYPIVVEQKNINRLVFLAREGECQQVSEIFSYRVADKAMKFSTKWYTASADIRCANHAPMAASQVATIEENDYLSFAYKTFGFSDRDPFDVFGGIKIETLPNKGKLILGNTLVAAGQVIEATNLNQLRYYPDTLQSGIPYASFQFKVKDAKAADQGWESMFSEQAYTYTINVIRLNHKPLSENVSITLNENEPYTFKASDFPFADPLDPTDKIASVKLLVDDPQWQLYFKGKVVTRGTIISIDEIGMLTYKPLANEWNETMFRCLFGVGDNNSTNASNGEQFSTIDYTLTIHVLPVNQPPVSENILLTMNEDETIALSSSMFSFQNPEDPTDKLAAVVIGYPAIGGKVTYKGTEVESSVTIPTDSLQQVVFHPNVNLWGTAASEIRFRVKDNNSSGALTGNAYSEWYSIKMNILPVNDAPLSGNKTIAVAYDGVYSFKPADFAFVDQADITDQLDEVLLVTLPQQGEVLFQNMVIKAPYRIAVSQIGQLTYVVGKAKVSVRELTFRVIDNNASQAANGKLQSEKSYKITFEAYDQNIAPEALSSTLTLKEDETVSLAARYFGFSDANKNDLPDSVQIVSLPQKGALTFGNQTVTHGKTIAFTEVSELKYSPLANEFGSPYAEIGFRVKDNNSTQAPNGALWSSNSGTISLIVQPVNDAPVLTSPYADITVDEFYSFEWTPTTGNFTDPDNALLSVNVQVMQNNWIQINSENKASGFSLPESDNRTTIVVRATDPQGLWAADTFNVTIIRKPRPLIYGEITCKSELPASLPVVLISVQGTKVDTLKLTATNTGYYYFENVAKGTYLVKAVNPAPATYQDVISTYYINEADWRKATTLSMEANTVVKANIEMATNKNTNGKGTVSGHVYLSSTATANGQIGQGQGGTPIPFVDIVLRSKDNNSVLLRTQSESDGSYSFKKVPYGEYVVTAEIPGFNEESPYYIQLNASTESFSNLNFVVYLSSRLISEKEALDNEGIMVFPNPTSGKVYIKTNNADKVLDVRVFNLHGQLILQKQFVPGMERSIDLSTQRKAAYTIEVRSNQGVETFTILLK